MSDWFATHSIGPSARTAQIVGGGSTQVNAHDHISPYEGVATQVGDAVELGYELGELPAPAEL